MKRGALQRPSFSPLPGILCLGLLLSGCQTETILGASQQMWLWLVIPLAGWLLLGALFITILRRRQLERWKVDQSEPSPRRFAVGIAIAAALPWAVFTVENFRAVIDPRQQMWNVGLWLLGSLFGATAGLLLGLRAGER